ncbi:MAG: hypothetical protein DI626_02685 [Micavibrio aeruginosavorus]|uniref:Uncharacterized protein n=1 Tax=Micavibrio aeruginosavorus TaxID=349221 RepID=A0A2W5A455_9BACT|nr:MAG: hypothetical protein DI626_02685 [Micavibrio aeruginosavorus]
MPLEKDMKINKFVRVNKCLLIAAIGFAGTIGVNTPDASAQIDMRKRPSLVITNDRAAGTGKNLTPAGNQSASPIYRSVSAPAVSPMPGDITASDVSGSSYFQPTKTMVGEKVDELRSDLSGLQSKVSDLSSRLKGMKERNQSMAAEYNASVATINTQLQSGTTPGNPRLVQKLSTAQSNLDRLSQSVAELNSMAVEAANAASMGSYLLDGVRSAYGLSGAVEEDHAALAGVEDQVNTTIVTVDRVLNEVNDDITRTAAYLSAERSNLRTLSLAVTNGDYYGRSLAGRPFANAPASQTGGGSMMQPASFPGAAPVPSVSAAPISSPRPLVKIKFDKPNVDYQQAVYMAVNEAMQKYPNARFELIAVNPSGGNAAQVAIESTRARRNAEAVLRSLSQMGVDADRIDLSTQQSAEARSNEVHIYIR